MITAPNPQPVFACDNLSIGYRNAEGRMTDVLVDVTLTLQPGGTLGIVGESGSGKSTLARALLGHLRPGSRVMGGSLSVLGTDMFGAAPRTVAAMRGTAVAIAMQNPLTSLTYHMTAGDQVMEVLKYRAGKSPADARQIMLDLFHEVGLPEPETMARRYPHQLSGGQRQRVVLAATLACNPALIVLDEPTSALDKTIEAQVLDLIDRIRRQRRAALVMISHDLQAVSRVCAEVAVLEKGHLVETGSTAEVFARPAHPYTQMLLKAAGENSSPLPSSTGAARKAILEARGLDFSYPNAHQAEQGRACVEYWIGRARGLGLDVVVSSQSRLMSADEPLEAKLYGYDTLHVSLDGRRRLAFAERAEFVTAEEIEARYDHARR